MEHLIFYIHSLREIGVYLKMTRFLCHRHSKNGGGALSVTPVRLSVRPLSMVSAQ